MTDLQRGDIVLAAFPFSDLVTKKRRPALVLNENTDQGDVIVAFVNTKLPIDLSTSSVIINSTDTDFPQTGLKTSSVIRLDKIATIERRLITRRLGRLSYDRLQIVTQTLIVALQISQ